MSKTKEILRLRSIGLSQKIIMASVHCASRTIKNIYELADDKGITYADIKDKSDDEVDEMFVKRKEVVYYHERPDYDYIHKELEKSGVTLMLLWEEYIEKCKLQDKPFLKYTQFCNLYKDHVEKNNLTMHINRKPGEKIEVDWAGTVLPIYDYGKNEIIGKSYLFVAVLPFSQMMYCEVSSDMKEASWINLHINMFRYFNGVPLMIVPDNLKTGVISHKRYEELVINKSYLEMAKYYGTAIIPARVRKPKDKASAESSVGYLTTQIIARLRNERFSGIDEANVKIIKILEELNRKPFQKREYSRYFVYINEELPKLNPLPEIPYEYGIWKEATVSYNYHIAFDKNYYSVPYLYLKKKVQVRITQFLIEIYFKGKRIASHKRLLGVVGKYSTNEEHMPDKHKHYQEWDSDRFKKWAQKIGPYTYQLICSIFDEVKIEQQMYQRCFAILKLANKDNHQVMEAVSKEILSKHITSRYKNFKMQMELIQQKYENKKIEEDTGAIIRGADYYGGNYD